MDLSGDAERESGDEVQHQDKRQRLHSPHPPERHQVHQMQHDQQYSFEMQVHVLQCAIPYLQQYGSLVALEGLNKQMTMRLSNQLCSSWKNQLQTYNLEGKGVHKKFMPTTSKHLKKLFFRLRKHTLNHTLRTCPVCKIELDLNKAIKVVTDSHITWKCDRCAYSDEIPRCECAIGRNFQYNAAGLAAVKLNCVVCNQSTGCFSCRRACDACSSACCEACTVSCEDDMCSTYCRKCVMKLKCPSCTWAELPCKHGICEVGGSFAFLAPYDPLPRPEAGQRPEHTQLQQQDMNSNVLAFQCVLPHLDHEGLITIAHVSKEMTLSLNDDLCYALEKLATAMYGFDMTKVREEFKPSTLPQFYKLLHRLNFHASFRELQSCPVCEVKLKPEKIINYNTKYIAWECKRCSYAEKLRRCKCTVGRVHHRFNIKGSLAVKRNCDVCNASTSCEECGYSCFGCLNTCCLSCFVKCVNPNCLEDSCKSCLVGSKCSSCGLSALPCGHTMVRVDAKFARYFAPLE